MPRKTKETEEIKKEVKKEVKKTTTKKASNTKKTTSSKNESKSKKKTTIKTTSKKSSSKKTATKKDSNTKKTTLKKPTIIPIVEYYDLPYRYNQTIVKILAQTPSCLFVYWDISDKDRENYKKTFGENFFEETKPVLVVHNNTLNYTFEVDINDFANSWYLHINDSKCNYSVELGRRPIINTIKINTDYIYISSSNNIETPNDKILFNYDTHNVYFRNVKTNVTSTKSISFLKNMGRIYNIYDLYKSIYKEDILDDLPSSTFK